MHPSFDFYPEDEGNTFLRNTGKLLSDYLASRPRRDLYIKRHENLKSKKI
jgi:hypothetical protein